MQTVSLQCSNCGWQLEYVEKERRYHCPACETNYLLDRDISDKSDFQIVAKKLEKYVGSTQIVQIPEDTLIIGKSAFEGIETIQSLSIPEGVYKIEENAFSGCTGLRYVSLPSTLKEIGAFAFKNSGLTVLILPESVNTVGKEAFMGCPELEKITLPSHVVLYERTFKACKKLTDVSLNLDHFCISFLPTGEARKKDDQRPTLFDAFQATPYYESLQRQYKDHECIRCHEKNIHVCPNCGLNYVDRAGGCYVATAVYGSYDCPEVWTLRRYRDVTLASTRRGRAFVRFYYAVSPKLVKILGNSKLFKKFWQGRLDRLVKKLNQKGFSNKPYQDPLW